MATGRSENTVAVIRQYKCNLERETTTQCAIFRVDCFYFLFFQPSLPPVRRCVSMRDDRLGGREGSDDPDGFTSAESDDVKADGCKSYGGGGWKIKRGGHRHRAGRSLYDATRGGVRDGMNGKGTQGRDGKDTHVYTGREKGRNGVGGEEGCGGSIIPVYIHSPHIHSGAKLLS